MLPYFGEGAIFIERGELMLQYPINFYPDGHTIDPSGAEAQRTISFTFKGDVLQSVHYKVYNYDTEELVANNFNYWDDGQYNGTTISNKDIFSDTSIFPINREYRYIVQCLLTQGQSNTLICDRFVLRGELVEDYDCTNDTVNMTLEDKINLIYEWNVDSQGIHTPVIENVSGTNRTFGIIKMRIGNEEHTILSYNYNTGEIVLDNAFTSDYPKGTPYQLYSNYLITQQYFVKTVATPSFSGLQANWAGESASLMVGVDFIADYPLTAYDYLKYYTVTLSKQVGDDVDGQPRHYAKIYETDKIYSQNIKARFVDDYDVYEAGGDFPVGNSNTRRYLFTVNGVLQNGMQITAELESVAPERDSTVQITNLSVEPINTGEYYNSAKITWQCATSEFSLGGGVRIYRYDMNVADIIRGRVLLASVYASDEEFIDGTVSTHGTYKYVLIPFGRSGVDVGVSFAPVISSTFTTDMYGYTITELRVGDSSTNYIGKQAYRLGESWHLRADIEDTTVTQNTDKVLHVGYGKYSSATHTGLNYMSGTFTGAIVQPNCDGETKWKDDINLVKAWREFITKDCIYLLRSQKGDVWVVNVVDNPTTTYDEKYKPITTSVSFNWAECASIDDIMVVSGNVW